MTLNKIIEVKCSNNFGVINRITSLFNSRGFSIEGLISSATEVENIYKIHIEVKYEQNIVDLIVRDIDKLIDVISVEEIDLGTAITTEKVFARIIFNQANIQEIEDVVNAHGADLLDTKGNTLFAALSGDKTKIDKFINDLKEVSETHYLIPSKLVLSEIK